MWNEQPWQQGDLLSPGWLGCRAWVSQKGSKAKLAAAAEAAAVGGQRGALVSEHSGGCAGRDRLQLVAVDI